ncbi:MAG: hypothetical protein K2K93_10840 [Muribaculaceae bacterium]|nr:hypothetical protein [Muribaculaceae bacterium]
MKEYGLIGKVLGHSYSAIYFNDKFAREGRDAHYYLSLCLKSQTFRT